MPKGRTYGGHRRRNDWRSSGRPSERAWRQRHDVEPDEPDEDQDEEDRSHD